MPCVRRAALALRSKADARRSSADCDTTISNRMSHPGQRRPPRKPVLGRPNRTVGTGIVVGASAILLATAILSLVGYLPPLFGLGADNRPPVDPSTGTLPKKPKASTSSPGSPLPPVPETTSFSQLSDAGRVQFAAGADARDIRVGGFSDPQAPYMSIGQAYAETTVTLVTNREYDRIRGWVGILADADCPENGSRLEIRNGRRRIWTASATDDARRFDLPIGSAVRVVLYGRATGSDSFCASQIGWGGLELLSVQ